MREEFDVVIVGAGSAGLSAIKEVRKLTSRFLLIDRGPLGTTCSRVGCMPSKVFIQEAHDHFVAQRLLAKGRARGELSVDFPAVMKRVRELRDYFVSFAVKDTLDLGDKYLKGEAQFIGSNLLKVGAREIHGRSVILATGSSPSVPDEWKNLGQAVVTTDQFFELDEIKKDWAVIGLGPLGLELGSALARFGCSVTGFQKKDAVGGIRDPEVKQSANSIFSDFMKLHLGVEVKLNKAGEKISVEWGSEKILVDQVLVATGRKPNLARLDLKQALCQMDDKGLPKYDPLSLQAECSDKKLRLFLAGDFSQNRQILHEAADEGRIAGFNSMQEKVLGFKRRTKMTITFSLPGIMAVGEPLEKLQNPLIGSVNFAKQGRSQIIGENHGLLRIYADRNSGLLLGAEMIGPDAEHLAHVLAGAISQKMEVRDLLRQPYYHPTVEEGLRTALRVIDQAMETKRLPGPELERLEF